jgi:Amt family ammonium transporter
VFRAKRGWDDALDVWACHGMGGVLGMIMTGVLAVKAVNGTSGLIEGNTHQFVWQCITVALTATYSFAVTYGALKVINIFTPVRVSEDVEEAGLDEALHGEKAYEFGV